MFKGKIRTLCGNEFTAFYLKAISLKEDSSSAEGHPEEYTNDLLKLGGGQSVDQWKKDYLKQYSDPDHPLNKHDSGAKYNTYSTLDNLNWMDVNENSAGGGYTFTDDGESKNN